MKLVRSFSFPVFKVLDLGTDLKPNKNRKQFFPWQEKRTQEEATC